MKKTIPILIAFIFLFVSSCNEPDPKGNLTGTVKDEVSDEPIENASVELQVNGVTQKTATSDITGAFSFMEIEPMQYNLNVNANDYQSKNIAAIVSDGQTENVSVVLLPSTGRLEGVVKNSGTGDLLASVSIQLIKDGNEITSYTTIADGGFVFNDLVPGSYIIEASKSDFKSNSKNITVKSGDVANGDINLTIAESSIPIVTTQAPHEIGQEYANIKGNIISTGNKEVTAHGHCWSETPAPNIDNSKVDYGKAAEGEFVSSLTGLKAGTLYYVRAFAVNGNGPDYSAEIDFETGANPSANFIANKTNVAIDEEISFSDKSSNAETWFWEFGDGENSTMQSPSHSYTSAGSYTVTLKVTNSYGEDTETKTNYITVGNLPNAEFSANKTAVQINETILFEDESANAETWSWNFGDDATSSIRNPSHSYTSIGSYIVTLKVTNNYGEDTETKTNFISVGQAPVAAFSVDKTTNATNTEVTFFDDSTNDPTSWSWDFGDGNTSAIQNPSHSYSTSGVYTVALTVTNSYGSDTETKSEYIIIGDPPIAAFSVSTDVSFNELISFTDESTNNPISWLWDFGDGSTSTIQNPQYSYSSGGVYTIALTVTNSFGSNTATKTDHITVTETYGTFTDSRDSKSYNWVLIGDQTWMAENNQYKPTSGYWDDNSSTYGIYYTWDAAQNACPTGWHLPNRSEWDILTTFYGGADLAGGKLKQTGTIFWDAPNTGATNNDGFSALGSGAIWSSGLDEVKQYTYFWTSEKKTTLTAYAYELGYNTTKISQGGGVFSLGFSVRCIKD